MILDTNALSAFVDGDRGVGELLRRQARACIPVIVLGEFRYGIAQSRHRAAYEQWLASELPHFDVLAITEETTVSYAELRVALRQIVGNAGEEPSVVLNKVAEGKGNFGMNAATGEYGDLVEMGVLDPTKVARTALQNASSVASLMLTTDAMVAELPKDDKPMGGPGGGMGGMGDMDM